MELVPEVFYFAPQLSDHEHFLLQLLRLFDDPLSYEPRPDPNQFEVVDLHQE